MSAPGEQPQVPVTLPNGVVQENPAAVTNALLIAARRAAENSAAAQDARESAELGKAALSFVQAVVILDPSLSQGGTPLEHDIMLQQTRDAGQVAVEQVRGENALKQAQVVAAAPTPRKKVTASTAADGAL